MNWFKRKPLSVEERIALNVSQTRPDDDAPTRAWVFWYAAMATSDKERREREKVLAVLAPSMGNERPRLIAPAPAHQTPQDTSSPLDSVESFRQYEEAARAAFVAQRAGAPGDFFDHVATTRDDNAEARIDIDRDEARAKHDLRNGKTLHT